MRNEQAGFGEPPLNLPLTAEEIDEFPKLPENIRDTDNLSLELSSLLDSDNPDIDAIKLTLSTLVSKANFALIDLRKIRPQYDPEYLRIIGLRDVATAKTYSVFQRLFDAGMSSDVVDVEAEPVTDVETSANFDGDNTNLMLDRTLDPIINAQLSRLIYLDRMYDLEIRTPVSREETDQNLTQTISEVSKDTPITFIGVTPTGSEMDNVRENMDVLYKMPEVYAENGVRQKNMIEAHEKGHSVRKVRSAVATTYFLRAVDFSVMEIPDERASKIAQAYTNVDPDHREISNDEAVEHTIHYLEHPMEIIERMAQLKNYFGMTGSQVFTKAHLEYARVHYVADTKFDNNMSEFLQCATPETEAAFLRIINSAGI